MISPNNPHEEDISLERVERRIFKRLDEIQEDFLLIGLSLGGMIALEYALNPSPYMKGIVVSGAQSKVNGEWLLAWPQAVLRLIPNFIYSKFLKQEKETAFNFSKSLLDFDIENKLPRIKCPTLVVVGSMDKPSQSDAYRIAQLIETAVLYEIEGGGHQLNKTHEKELAGIVAEFSKRID